MLNNNTENKICTSNLPQIMSSLEFVFFFIHEQPVKFSVMNYSDLFMNLFENISAHSCHTKQLNENILVFLLCSAFFFPSPKVPCCIGKVEMKKGTDRGCLIISGL